MKKSEQLNEIGAALSAFQGTVKSILKNKEAKIPTKSGTSFSYSYADLESIWDNIQDSLCKNGLSVIQGPANTTLDTLILHKSGQWLESSIELNCLKAKTQELGSEITYLKRYCLCSMLGLVSGEEDDDGALAHSAEIKPKSNNKISPTQARELTRMLKHCPEDYQSRMDTHLKQNLKLQRLEDLQTEQLNSIKSSIERKLQESLNVELVNV